MIAARNVANVVRQLLEQADAMSTAGDDFVAEVLRAIAYDVLAENALIGANMTRRELPPPPDDSPAVLAIADDDRAFIIEYAEGCRTLDSMRARFGDPIVIPLRWVRDE